MNTNESNWQSVINAIPSLCWGIIVLIAIYLVLKYFIQPWMKNCHERKMKDVTYNNEKVLAKNKEENANSDESLKENNRKLNDENKELKNKLDIEKCRSSELRKHLEEYKNHLNIIMTNLKK